jgi:large conductance mechanosensitive channel
MVVKGFNAAKKKEEEAAPPAPPANEVLLGEIRDLLKEKA